ncbi:general stress protein [Peribacillus butanolivorans]|uniref:general stress protein n=1 Tax=Peribacillus butanolivorans TaxID=421767 RepID=UPI0030C9E21C
MRRNIEKRLFYLYTGELFSIISFVFLSYIINYVYPKLHLYSLYSFWIAFLFLEFLLLQGTVYWYVKWKKLKKEKTSITPVWIVQRLKDLQKVNVGMIIAGLIMFVIDFFYWYPLLPLGGLSIAGFIYVFALLEYINYYYVQLSYDNISDIKYLVESKRLKQASINKDFKRIL